MQNAGIQSLAPCVSLSVALAGLGGVLAALQDKERATLVCFSCLVCIHAVLGVLAVRRQIPQYLPLLGTAAWSLEMFWSLMVRLSLLDYPIIARKLYVRGIGLLVCIFFAVMGQAPARALLPTWVMLGMAGFHAYLRWHAHCHHVMTPDEKPGFWDGFLVWQVLLALLPCLVHSWWYGDGRLWRGPKQGPGSGIRPASRLIKAGQGSSQTQLGDTRMNQMRICDSMYTSALPRPLKVCVRVRTAIPVSSLPHQAAQDIQQLLTQGLQKTYGEAACVRDLAIRRGSVIIRTELRLPEGVDVAVDRPSDLDWLLGGVLPSLLKNLAVLTGDETPDMAINEVQVNNMCVHVRWDDQAHEYVCTSIMPLQPAEAEPISLGLVWACPEGSTRVDAAAAADAHKVQLQVQVLGISSCAAEWDVLGSEPYAPGSASGSKHQLTEAGAGSSALQLWANCTTGYQPVRVLGVSKVWQLRSAMVLVEVDMPSNSLLKHHTNSPPACVQFISLELWQGTLLLSDARLVVAPVHLRPGLQMPVSFWGTPASLAAEAVCELHERSQQAWQAGLAEQSLDMDAAQGHMSFMGDVALWLEGVWCTAVASGSCIMAASCAAAPRLKAGTGLPLQAFSGCVASMTGHARTAGLQQVSRLLQHQLTLPWVKAALKPGKAAAAAAAPPPSPPSAPHSVLQRLYISCVGYDCPACEQLYGQRIQSFTVPMCVFASCVNAVAVLVCLLMHPGSVGFITACVASTWTVCHITQGLLLLRAAPSPRTNSIIGYMRILSVAAYIISMWINYMVPTEGVLPAVVKAKQNSNWMLNHAYVSLTEFVPIHGLVPAGTVTWLSVLAALLVYVTSWPGHPWWNRALGSAATTVLLPLLADMHLRKRLMGSRRSSHSQAQHPCSTAGCGSWVQASSTAALNERSLKSD